MNDAFRVERLVMNIIAAIVCGLVIDKTFKSHRHRLGLYMRVFLQLATIVATIYATEIMYLHAKLGSVTESVFFVSMFLGVQGSLFSDIQSL